MASSDSNIPVATNGGESQQPKFEISEKGAEEAEDDEIVLEDDCDDNGPGDEGLEPPEIGGSRRHRQKVVDGVNHQSSKNEDSKYVTARSSGTTGSEGLQSELLDEVVVVNDIQTSGAKQPAKIQNRRANNDNHRSKLLQPVLLKTPMNADLSVDE